MSLTQIDQGKIQGEKFTGYEGPEKGPFACHNCEYYKGGSCGQSTMMEHSKLPRVDSGRVRVDADGCCEYVSRVGKKGKPMKKNWMKAPGKPANGPTMATEENQRVMGATKKPDARPGKRFMQKGKTK